MIPSARLPPPVRRTDKDVLRRNRTGSKCGNRQLVEKVRSASILIAQHLDIRLPMSSALNGHSFTICRDAFRRRPRAYPASGGKHRGAVCLDMLVDNRGRAAVRFG